MKTNYVIYDNNFEETGIVFDNEETAKFFAKLNSKQFAEYHVKKQLVYESFKDYLKHNRYKIADALYQLANKIEQGEIRFDLQFKNGVVNTNYRDLQYMAEKKRISLSCMWDKNTNKPIKIELEDVDAVVNKYNEVKNKVADYKALADELSETINFTDHADKIKDVLDIEL